MDFTDVLVISNDAAIEMAEKQITWFRRRSYIPSDEVVDALLDLLGTLRPTGDTFGHVLAGDDASLQEYETEVSS